MGKYNFDQIVERGGMGTHKVDRLKEMFGRDDLIPLWIADMDFLSPPQVTEAIMKRVEHGIFGYTHPTSAYYQSIMSWLENNYNWQIKKEWLSFIPGIVKGLAFTIDCFLSKDEKVIIQPPVYAPFRNIPTLHKRQIVNNPLILCDGRYFMDLDQFKSAIDPSCRLLILCNPHNPGGRIWTHQELVDIADVCYDNNILVVSDEIHSDLALQDHRHIPFASVSDKAAQNSITFMAPSKTFNIAGIVSSFSVIPNDDLRKRFHQYLAASELGEGHIFAYTATEAAYSQGNEWLTEAKEYIWDNICFVDQFLKKNVPQIKAMIPEASFLVWLDCRELNLSQDDLVSFFIHDARLALNNGASFGQGGEGFMRLNVGSPRLVIEEAMNRLKQAIDKCNK